MEHSIFWCTKHHVGRASTRKGVKHLRDKWIENPTFNALGTCSQILPQCGRRSTVEFT